MIGAWLEVLTGFGGRGVRGPYALRARAISVAAPLKDTEDAAIVLCDHAIISSSILRRNGASLHLLDANLIRTNLTALRRRLLAHRLQRHLRLRRRIYIFRLVPFVIRRAGRSRRAGRRAISDDPG